MENNYIMGFDSWLSESDNYQMNVEELFEGKMSEIDLLAQEALNFEEFIASFEQYAQENKINIEIDDDTRNWLKKIFDEAERPA